MLPEIVNYFIISNKNPCGKIAVLQNPFKICKVLGENWEKNLEIKKIGLSPSGRSPVDWESKKFQV